MPDELSSSVESSGGSEDLSADSLVRAAVAISEFQTGDRVPAPRVAHGDVIADRFAVECRAGSGGMGTVYRALDRLSGATVALKVMMEPGRHDRRFVQEARVLARLQHPCIVRYVAHGSIPDGQLYLAMDWLEGEDLAKRLARTGLSVRESLDVVRRVAEGLSHAHATGVVHRDVKPNNIMLVGGEASRATLLDFGIVRVRVSEPSSQDRPRTRTGMLLGTVGYMSPEQAIADKRLDARTDVFALGCVLFECLTGQPAFAGGNAAAVLAKVLCQEAQHVRALRPELPPALDEFIARLLAKDPAARPEDGAAVLRELEALDSLVPSVRAPEVRGASAGLSDREQRLVSVLLAQIAEQHDDLSEVLRRYGSDFVRLANGVLLVTPRARSATDEPFVRAARCALELHQRFPTARFALAMGHAQTTDEGMSGQVIDRAAALLAESISAGVRIDEITAGLLQARFEIQPADSAHVLVGVRTGVEAPRRLLGRLTPCVGRDRELALLEGRWSECVEETVARGVLVTGPAGQGKSRMRHELLARVVDRWPEAGVLMARADPMGAGSSFVLARQLVRQAAGLRESDPQTEQEHALRAYIARRCAGGEAGRIADFLGTLLGFPFPSRCSPQARAAQNDAQVMAEWLRRSFSEWLAAECSARPVLVVLEDLQWGDWPSINYVTRALRELPAKPLMVLALARPELHDTFPDIQRGTELDEMSLTRLTPRAAENLVRVVLGQEVPAQTVARIVDRAQGNAFFLEELIRRVAEGGGDSLPETVATLVQSRIERLEDDVRRVVRAASVFGEVFWKGAVAALLGAAPKEIDKYLEHLVDHEVIVPATSNRFPDESEYSFRHGLLREVAYMMLTDPDRAKGHLLGGEWLERAGEMDGLVIADHYERGGQPARALPWLLRAAQRGFEGGNLDAAIALAERGIARGAEGEAAGLLRVVQGSALGMRTDWPASIEASRAAMARLTAGSTPWFQAAASGLRGALFAGDFNVTASLLPPILQAPSPDVPSGPYGLAVYHTCVALAGMGQIQIARSLIERAEACARGVADPDPGFGQFAKLAAVALHALADEPGLALSDLAEVTATAPQTANMLALGASVTFSVLALAQVGDCPKAEEAAHRMRDFSEMTFLTEWISFGLNWARVEVGRASEAIPRFRRALGLRDMFLASSSRAGLAFALLEVGDLQAAQQEADGILAMNVQFPLVRVSALATLARIELQSERPAGALARADEGLRHLTSAWPSIVTTLHLTRAEALRTIGRTDDARATIREGRDRVFRIAGSIADLELRASWLTNIAPNKRLLALAGELPD